MCRICYLGGLGKSYRWNINVAMCVFVFYIPGIPMNSCELLGIPNLFVLIQFSVAD